MKTIKLTTLLFSLTFTLFIITQAGCNKYPEGPSFSLRSRTSRVANTWRVENYKLNGTDLTSLVSGYSEKYTKQGDYSYSWGILNGNGTWSFQNNATEIKLKGNDDRSNQVLHILKLEEKSFWYYYMEGDDRHELHLTPN